MKNNQKCKFGVYKHCMDCERSFIDTVWCGDILCNRCLEMCWLVDNSEIAERILGCCDYHRPYISLNNVKSTPILTSNNRIMTDGFISKPSDIEFETPLGNFKSFRLPPKSDNISIPTKEKVKDRHTESRSLPLTQNTPIVKENYSTTSTSINSTTPTTSLSTNDSFFSVDFFSKLLSKKK